MKRENLLNEYEATLNSLVEKTKFVYSEEFYKLNEFEKQKFQKDKMTTEAHLSTLCELLWGEKVKFGSDGLGSMVALGILSSMFGYGGGFGSSTSGADYLKKQLSEDEKKEQEAVYAIPATENKTE